MLNEAANIGACIASLLAGTYPSRQLEILAVDGGSTDNTVAIVKEIERNGAPVKLLTNPRRIQSAAFNIGLEAARGTIIMRADAHSTYSENYVQLAVKHLSDPQVINVGGIFVPVANNSIGRAIGLCTVAPLGNGGAKYRQAERTGVRLVDTVPYGAWRRADILHSKGLREDWLINEDYELNIRLRKTGKKILLEPQMKIFYRCRDRFALLFRQYVRYGFWRVKTTLEHPRHSPPHLFAPAALLVSIAASTAWAFAVHWVPLMILLTLYTAVVLFSSVRIADGFDTLLLVPIVFCLMHLAFGLGTIGGLVYWPLFNRRSTSTQSW